MLRRSAHMWLLRFAADALDRAWRGALCARAAALAAAEGLSNKRAVDAIARASLLPLAAAPLVLAKLRLSAAQGRINFAVCAPRFHVLARAGVAAAHTTSPNSSPAARALQVRTASVAALAFAEADVTEEWTEAVAAKWRHAALPDSPPTLAAVTSDAEGECNCSCGSTCPFGSDCACRGWLAFVDWAYAAMPYGATVARPVGRVASAEAQCACCTGGITPVPPREGVTVTVPVSADGETTAPVLAVTAPCSGLRPVTVLSASAAARETQTLLFNTGPELKAELKLPRLAVATIELPPGLGAAPAPASAASVAATAAAAAAGRGRAATAGAFLRDQAAAGSLLAIVAPALALTAAPRWVPLFSVSPLPMAGLTAIAAAKDPAAAAAAHRPPPAAALPGALLGALGAGGLDAVEPEDLALSGIDYHCSNMLPTILTPALRTAVDAVAKGHAQWLCERGAAPAVVAAAAAAAAAGTDAEGLVKNALWRYRSGLTNKVPVHTLGADALRAHRVAARPPTAPAALGVGLLSVLHAIGPVALGSGPRRRREACDAADVVDAADVTHAGDAAREPRGASECAWALGADPVRGARALDEGLLLWRVYELVRAPADGYAAEVIDSRGLRAWRQEMARERERARVQQEQTRAQVQQSSMHK